MLVLCIQGARRSDTPCTKLAGGRHGACMHTAVGYMRTTCGAYAHFTSGNSSHSPACCILDTVHAWLPNPRRMHGQSSGAVKSDASSCMVTQSRARSCMRCEKFTTPVRLCMCTNPAVTLSKFELIAVGRSCSSMHAGSIHRLHACMSLPGFNCWREHSLDCTPNQNCSPCM